jgi:hypothetical protein
MLVRNCAGGVVFHRDKVLILKNEKHEWVFPKGVVRSNNLPEDVAVERVAYEAAARRASWRRGRTNYEFLLHLAHAPGPQQDRLVHHDGR